MAEMEHGHSKFRLVLINIAVPCGEVIRSYILRHATVT